MFKLSNFIIDSNNFSIPFLQKLHEKQIFNYVSDTKPVVIYQIHHKDTMTTYYILVQNEQKVYVFRLKSSPIFSLYFSFY